jgi:type IV pilus assembly protein PilZ
VDDKRSHPRVTLDTAVVCSLPDGSEISGRSKDISIGGMFLFTSSTAAFGTQVQLRLRLPSARQELVLPAVVRWSSPEGLGLQFGLLGARETHAISELLRK